MNKRALISVYAKTNLIDFAKGLVELGWEIISTGGTANLLLQEKIPVTKVSDITGFPEILGGRVKTLHPRIHGGILARRDKISDLEELKGQNIKPVDLVVVNLYPFKETVQTEGASHEDIIENIDIGGPALIRAAAKNYPHVGVIVNPAHYDLVLNELRSKGSLSLTTREKLAREAFLHTAHYDALISSYFSSRMTDGSELFQKEMLLPLQKVQDLRYGENPQQKAAFYKDSYSPCPGLPQIKQLHGKELSFNNLNDLQAAWELSREFTETTVVAVKHTNPCGVASGKTIFDAYVKAYEADPVSIFGGIIVCNREIDELTAEKMSETFLEIVAAPSFSTAATEILKKKKNLRLLLLPAVGKKCT
ncbi:MAG: bifunctional phosphoribosylaminoimidazolecarboxamide formyltransferase/IMP cyclohydrolase, partial [Firmicutes bacterium]|nr:bifunctional phosphoribosylaminoimidazolecarboxamide formyltransferase/IMP cyclohydrolase [Bacillota bacterium]